MINYRRQGSVLFVVVMLLGLGSDCLAQARAPQRASVAIKKLEGRGRNALVLTPRYDSNVSGEGRELREWGRVRVEYATRPEWLDELTIRFFALGVMRVEGRNLYSLYRKEVRYMDIKGDSDHLAEVYVRPSAIERYGEIAAVAVEFVLDGKVVDVATDPKKSKSLPEQWWKDPRVVKSEAVTIRDAHILNRKESPFAFANMQDFEAIK
ncbi:MAG: hypothetical protein ISS35_10515 [Kiritimatiellae bacterium]|nr:hypothetical protein [Kiritimatiellia bacterium]